MIMPSPSKPNIPKAAEPIHGQSFDPWNSSSTGHQRAENRLGASTGWRDSRNKKLMSQFTGGASGGVRVSDTVGAGSQDWDAKAKALIPPEVRARAQTSVLDMLAKPGTTKSKQPPSRPTSESTSDLALDKRKQENNEAYDDGDDAEGKQSRKLFDGVVVYVNGSTFPLISDHKLKHVLAENGGKMSSHLGRRKVTHVILGRPAGGGGSGGGLAAGKLQREIQKLGGASVKYVSVEWVLESIRVGKRLPEARFADLKVASRTQGSVYGMFSASRAESEKGGTPPSGFDASQPPPSGQRQVE